MLATESVKLLSNSGTEAVMSVSMWRWWTRKRQKKIKMKIKTRAAQI